MSLKTEAALVVLVVVAIAFAALSVRAFLHDRRRPR